jgi:hypothetical protein
LAEANIVTVDADQALAYNRLFLTPSALQAVEDCFRILETFKALKVVVLAGNPFIKTLLTQVQVFTQGAAKANPKDRACFARSALMPRVGYVLPCLVFECVEMLLILMLHTHAAEVIVLNNL